MDASSSDADFDDEALFVSLYPSLRHFAGVVRPAGVEADDLVQEALARTLAIRSLSECDEPGAYLRMAIVRLAANHRRSLGRRRRAVSRAAVTDVVEPSYPSDIDDLLRLSVRDRAVLYLAVVESRPYAEIAAVLGCSEEAARARASRALRRLRVELTAERQEAGNE